VVEFKNGLDVVLMCLTLLSWCVITQAEFVFDTRNFVLKALFLRLNPDTNSKREISDG
jgi:hypothetical protein